MEWGALGDGPGEFDLLHGLAVDEDRVYVGDRQNNRIQLFTHGGEFIEEWPNIFDPVNIWLDENRAVWVLDASLNRVLKYNRDGVLQYHWVHTVRRVLSGEAPGRRPVTSTPARHG